MRLWPGLIWLGLALLAAILAWGLYLFGANLDTYYVCYAR